MARAYSLDLRTRVIEAIEAGLSTREAARRFAIGISTSGGNYSRPCQGQESLNLWGYGSH
ncbi:hypothetical protein D3227_39770 [Mesorhizobium waimense]|uniref:Transposase Synechocystis PCC 6803 domain-containing protein n=1 Tax=Mesorhizobium waimense TaxID=1300307 RepID=A0A3A5JVY4_9HYPH|nr:hypothetical protein D3227_39770 [Mesorhizobium waimense]